MSLIAELKRRNVLRVGAAYVVASWLVIQVVETIFPVYGLSDAAIRLVISALAVLFIPVLVFAWVFELTPEGLKREKDIDQRAPVTARKTRMLDRTIMVVLALGIGYFAFDKFVLSGTREAEIAAQAREQGRTESILETYGEKSIAVLPFQDMSPDKDQEYMSDGIAEEILNLLARVADLRVISRSSAFTFKGTNLPVPEVAAKLNAAYILEGSVRLAGDQLRITAQLIEAHSDTHLWSETYDRTLENVFDIQDDIAAAVVDNLTSTLLGEVPKSRHVDEEAYKLALQARYLWWRRAEGDEQRALEMYQQAVDIDPGYAPAWTGLSVAYAVAAQKGRIDREEGLAKAREAIDRAFELDPDDAEVRIRLSQALSWDGDYEGRDVHTRKAVELDPDNPLVLGVMAARSGHRGRIDDVVAYSDRAATVDPVSAIWPGNKGTWLTAFRRADEAEEALRRAYELNGNTRILNENMADIHNMRGDYDKALDALAEVPAEGLNLTRKAIALYGSGREVEADELFSQIRSDAATSPQALLGVAQIYAARGENDEAFEWLRKLKGQMHPVTIVYDAYTRALTADPRWKPFVDSLDWYWEYEY